MRYDHILCLLFVGATAQPAYAASFDCNAATSTNEKEICANKELSKLDEELAIAYRNAQSAAKDYSALRVQQQFWLKEIRDRCRYPECLKLRYIERISQLSSPKQPNLMPSGKIDCSMDSSISEEGAFDSKRLVFGLERRALTYFTWDATWAPSGDTGLRPGFHYSSYFTLSRMQQRSVPGLVLLEGEPISGLSERLQEFCGVAIVAINDKLHVYTIGCESAPSTSTFDFMFRVSDSTCTLINNER